MPCKQLCTFIKRVACVSECPQKVALWVLMCSFWWCHFLCSSMRITNPTDWQYVFSLDACGACPLDNAYNHAPWGLFLWNVGKRWACREDLLVQADTWPHSHQVLQWALLRAEQGADRLLWRTQCPEQQQTWPLNGSSAPVTEHSLSGMGSARNDNYLVIRKRQQAEAFCEIASYSLHVSLGMNLWDICKRKVNAQGPEQVAFKM